MFGKLTSRTHLIVWCSSTPCRMSIAKTSQIVPPPSILRGDMGADPFRWKELRLWRGGAEGRAARFLVSTFLAVCLVGTMSSWPLEQLGSLWWTGLMDICV